MISIPIQNRVVPIVGALAGGLWFVLVVAALLLMVSGVAFAALEERPTRASLDPNQRYGDACQLRADDRYAPPRSDNDRGRGSL